MTTALRVTAVVVAWAVVAHAGPPMRQEPVLAFAIDEPFQQDGGVQYFYALTKKDAAASSPTVAFFRGFDEGDRWSAAAQPVHVVTSRIVYTVEKDAAFFTEARATDVGWMNAVAPELQVTARPDGGFHAGKMPSNDFTVRFLEGAALAAQPGDGGVARLVSLLPDAGVPASVVVQENFDFARVMGVRTGAFSVTWTGHLRLGPGRTRVHVVTMSAIHTLPPFFLGGERRVFNESVAGALDLIERLRAAPVSPPSAPRAP